MKPKLYVTKDVKKRPAKLPKKKQLQHKKPKKKNANACLKMLKSKQRQSQVWSGIHN
jgi:hypothetical protein